MGSLICLNVGCADASVIKTDTETILVDCHNIGDFPQYLPANKFLRGVFITHQHNDHYSGLDYLLSNGYQIETLIYSPYERRINDASVTIEEWNEFNNLKNKFIAKGTKTYTPYRQNSFDQPYWKPDGLRFEIIGPAPVIAKSDTREIHDACLVVKAYLGSRVCLFTGDASDANLENIALTTSDYCGDILHASHHGSINGAQLDFIKKANAQYTLISTASGVHENVPHPTALKRYSDNTSRAVKRTDVDGSWEWTF